MDKLIEKIAEKMFDRSIQSSTFNTAEPKIREYYLSVAESILDLIKEAGYVQLAADQSLLENPYYLPIKEYEEQDKVSSYNQAQQDMTTVKDGTVWMKVVQP